MIEYKEGQNCPACNTGQLKMIGGDMQTIKKVHVVESQFECWHCREKFIDEKRYKHGALLKKM